MYHGDALKVMAKMEDESVDLILTSPPFALTRPKAYGNETETKYVEWFMQFAWEFHRILKQDGSLVVDLGGAWVPGQPTKSLYQWRLLIDLVDRVKFNLAQDFYWFNRAKIPGPAQWVTVNRVRVKDSVNTIWWLSKSPNPNADNKRVLTEYSKSMQKLLGRGTYNEGSRPGGQSVGKKWATDHGGAISPNVLEFSERDLFTSAIEGDGAYDELFQAIYEDDVDNMLDFSNTNSTDPYHQYCKHNQIRRHPARFPHKVPDFFIRFLTEPGNLVFDPFGGSNVTGAAAEALQRKWKSCDLDIEYIAGSLGRFPDAEVINEPIIRKSDRASNQPRGRRDPNPES
jgi:DNA modification methylase